MVTAVASMAVVLLVCPSTGMRMFNTLLLANLSLHCLICFHSLDFGSDIANIGPELHSMPINHLSIFSNVSVMTPVFRLLDPSSLCLKGFSEQSDLHGHCSGIDGCCSACLSVDRHANIQHTSVGQSELALFDLLSLSQFFGSNTTTLGLNFIQCPSTTQTFSQTSHLATVCLGNQLACPQLDNAQLQTPASPRDQ